METFYPRRASQGGIHPTLCITPLLTWGLVQLSHCPNVFFQTFCGFTSGGVPQRSTAGWNAVTVARTRVKCPKMAAFHEIYKKNYVVLRKGVIAAIIGVTACHLLEQGVSPWNAIELNCPCEDLWGHCVKVGSTQRSPRFTPSPLRLDFQFSKIKSSATACCTYRISYYETNKDQVQHLCSVLFRL